MNVNSSWKKNQLHKKLSFLSNDLKKGEQKSYKDYYQGLNIYYLLLKFYLFIM